MSDNIQEKVEDKIIDQIALGAQGRLVAFKPENSRADLVVKKRGDYKSKEIFFQINIFVKDFLPRDFTADKDLYLIFISFDEVGQKINDKLWLVPSLHFNKATESGDFSQFLINQKLFVDFLIDAFLKK